MVGKRIKDNFFIFQLFFQDNIKCVEQEIWYEVASRSPLHSCEGVVS
jgi:hypothetical protein